ncbi:MAG: tRNA lysidine(34) synthetase TilS [Bacteroidales bacterium]|jgi:tRNA(Ile)-lysidine synthase|nr:tRNA lysidine(34) synthetase TilS [Bacteroidales bacterium]NCU35837.1 tRNA lysidine(34) synthetase TilS [Candidatus Falkowbacteria bacterium]MDD2632946.1 tRNA lysidine(34) synthetase TilS [Bacteroidales bacterium]MDD4176809.1 tRNA lysidine(34) synthetase TilS [Bacteroidales bacterium]MDD4741945.1 tRNA lysidine(34) synthetase TilS [Bacteroidales bacterium]
MLANLQKYIFDHQLLVPGQKILLTVSGGIDSMVMAHLLRQLPVKVALAHCNFSLRGAESDTDENFLRDYAQKNKLHLYVKRFDTVGYATLNNHSTQIAARDLRYAWFEELMNKEGFDAYVTAHNFDDQVETFLINLLRGTGIAGLQGIKYRNGNCIRPLLFATRLQIVDYAMENNIAFREDSSNQTDDYLRNRLRHHVLPALKESSERFETGFKSTFEILKQTHNFIDDEIKRRRSLMVKEEGDYTLILLSTLRQEAHQDFVLFELLRPFGFNQSDIGDIIKSLDATPGKHFLSASHRLMTDREHLVLMPLKKEEKTFDIYKINDDDQQMSYPLQLHFSRIERQELQLNKSLVVAQLDYDKLQFPLTLRRWQRGDYFYPLGMRGRKKLSDFITDQKISTIEKQNLWLLLSGHDIVWVAGHRIDERYKVSSATQKVFVVELEAAHGAQGAGSKMQGAGRGAQGE